MNSTLKTHKNFLFLFLFCIVQVPTDTVAWLNGVETELMPFARKKFNNSLLQVELDILHENNMKNKKLHHQDKKKTVKKKNVSLDSSRFIQGGEQKRTRPIAFLRSSTMTTPSMDATADATSDATTVKEAVPVQGGCCCSKVSEPKRGVLVVSFSRVLVLLVQKRLHAEAGRMQKKFEKVKDVFKQQIVFCGIVF